MGASVWSTSGRFSPGVPRPLPTPVSVRWTAEITPTVTEPWLPRGLPMATTGSPTTTLVESANAATGSVSVTFTTPTSSSGSVPCTWAT